MSRVGENPHVGGTAFPGNVGGPGGAANSGRVGDSDFSVGHGDSNFEFGGANELFDANGNFDSATLDNMSFKLDGLSKSSGDIFALMALIVQMSKEQREGARQVAAAQQLVQQMELQNAADEMRKAADLALAAAIVSGIFKAVSAGVSIGGGIKGLKDLGGASDATGDVGKTASKTSQLTDGTDDVADLTKTGRPRANARATKPTDEALDGSISTKTTSKKVDQKLEEENEARLDEVKNYQKERKASEENLRSMEIVRNKGRIFDGTGQMITTTGDMIAAGLTHASTNHQADQKVAEARAQQAESFVQREQEFSRTLEENINKVVGLIQDIQQSNNETDKRAASV
jgi:hypothetical protein